MRSYCYFFGCLRFNVTTEKEPKDIAHPFIYKSIQIYSGWFFILETEIEFCRRQNPVCYLGYW